jgi:hypothetical protein
MTRYLITPTTSDYEGLFSNNINDGFLVANYNDSTNGTEESELGTHPDENRPMRNRPMIHH